MLLKWKHFYIAISKVEVNCFSWPDPNDADARIYKIADFFLQKSMSFQTVPAALGQSLTLCLVFKLRFPICNNIIISTHNYALSSFVDVLCLTSYLLLSIQVRRNSKTYHASTDLQNVVYHAIMEMKLDSYFVIVLLG